MKTMTPNKIPHRTHAPNDSMYDMPHSVELPKLSMSLDRQVRLLAGFLVILGVVLSQHVNPNFAWLAGLVGAVLMFSGLTDTCGMKMFLAKMPWNR